MASIAPPPVPQGLFSPCPHQTYPSGPSPQAQPWMYPRSPLPPAHLYPPPAPGYFPPPPHFHGPPNVEHSNFHPPHLWGQGHPRPPYRGRGRGRARGSNNGPAQLFECKVCSKEYKSEETYSTHLQSHQKCDKCEFSAVPRVLKEHKLMHILPDMLKFTSPEEIQKWREERKKNWPTSENIARKKQMVAEKKARGETALTPLHRYISHLVGEDHDERGGRGRWRGCGRWRGRGGGFRGRRGGRGRGHWHNNRGEGTQEEEAEGEKLSELVVEKSTKIVDQVVNNDQAIDGNKELSQHNEGIKDECLDEGREEVESHKGIMEAILADTCTAVKTGVINTTRGVKDTTVTGAKEGGVGNTPGLESAGGSSEVDNVSTSEAGVGREQQKPSQRGRKRRNHQQGSQQQFNKRKCTSVPLERMPAKKPTLLEKLLASEVRKEQNTLLQCIRYVVDTGFLGLRGAPHLSQEDRQDQGGAGTEEVGEEVGKEETGCPLEERQVEDIHQVEMEEGTN